eukprot:14417825-Heterocapsa_arctica.AAC.1
MPRAHGPRWQPCHAAGGFAPSLPICGLGSLGYGCRAGHLRGALASGWVMFFSAASQAGGVCRLRLPRAASPATLVEGGRDGSNGGTTNGGAVIVICVDVG